MTDTSLMLGVVLLGLLLMFVTLPLLAAWRAPVRTGAEAGSVAALEEQLSLLVNAVRDLDFDHDTGKLSEADYVAQRKLLVGRGVSTLMRLERARNIDQQLEELVASYRNPR
ncbi:MAG: hypothetical protein HC915_10365 [Anaerolineae bacterium]|nr:hypothetical protein [Anaerolineae bacterium]